MKKMKKKVLAGSLVFGLGALGMGMTAQAQPYWHGGGYGQGGGGPCWSYDGGASASGWREVAKQRTASLLEKLKLNEAQQKAWKDYQAAIAANIKAVQDRELIDYAGMTAPQRLEKRQQLMKERDARMEKHLGALKTFYATLTPEQQQIFDAESLPGAGYGYHRGGRGRGARGGPGRPGR